MEEFLKLRKRLHDALKRAAKEEPGKSYEGEMEIAIHYPGIYDDSDEADTVIIRADFYLLGPSRHYSWKGNTIKEAVEKASADFDSWLGDDNECAENARFHDF